MAAKINNLNWKSVALEGIPMSVSDQLQGFIGLEECTDYSFDNSGKKPLKKKQQDSTKKQQEKKRKELAQNTLAPIPSKKIKLSNGFLVETCHSTKPSSTNEASEESSKKKRRNKSKTKEEKDSNTQINLQKSTNTEVKSKKKKPKLGENLLELSQLTLQDMDAWSEFQIPEEIIKALAEQGFKKPTKIQEISLPSAMLGRRDILGAAETGSGKTLAFGIPILTGIMRLKEKAQAGVDVYDMPYKKSSAKQKEPAKKVKNITFNKKSVNKKKKVESSEDGYGSGSASEEEEIDVEKSSEAVAAESTNSSDVDYSDDEVDSDDDGEESADEEFVEEYDVPIRKKKTSIEDDNSNDSDGYIHLSEMLDSDDLANSSDEEHDDVVNPNDDDEVDDDNDDEIGSEDEELQEEVVDENLEGIGCVKVIDNIDMPGHNITKTGKPLYALILTPTRELAMQVSRHLISAAKYTGIRVATIVGGMAAVKQERVLSKSPEIVVATPGRLWELLRQGQTHLEQLDNIKFLAIDETDRMVERNHFEELHPLLERLNSDETRKSSRQNFVFSATLTMVHDLPTHMKGKKVTKNGKILNRKVKKMTAEQKVKKLVEMIGMTDPKVVDITQQNLGTADSLTECRITCGIEQKDQHLYYVLKRHPGRTIVFCNSIGSVKRLAQLFSLLQCHPLPLHASMPQRQRLKNLERFRDDPNGVLVATDVAARGLDIPNVDHVIHYQVPRTAENYVHRSGRTARANKEGLTILMMEPGEAHLYSKICRTLNKTTELPTFPTPSHVLGTMKEIVTLARELDVLQLRHRRVAQEHGWLDKAAREMDMLIDEDFVQKSEKDDSIGKALQIKKKRLENLIAKPLFPKGFSYKYPTLNDSDLLNGRTDEKALAVMKKAIESGEYKKQKRKSKNAPLLNLEKVNKKALELGKKRQK